MGRRPAGELMLKLNLFGTGQASYCDRPLAGFPNQQCHLLLCYLLLNRHHPHYRERLAAVFWGDSPTAVARKSLRNALWRLRCALHAAGADDAEDVPSFKAAVKAAYEAPAFAANLLFGVRSRQLLFGSTPAAARETLSGTLIGVELAAGLSGAVPQAGVMLIASGRLAMLYRVAFEALSVTAKPVDADEAVRRGLSMAAAAIWTK